MKILVDPKSRTLLAGLLLSLCSLPLLLAADRNVPADYPTIQAAVDAAGPGDTIRIAPGDYYEQIIIVDKANLSLVGEPGAIIHAFNGMTQTLAPYGATAIVSLGLVRSDVVVAGLTFHGESLGDSYPNPFIGVLFQGSSGKVTNCIVRSFRAFGSAVVRGIYVANLVRFGTPVVDVAVLNSTFADNNRSISLGGDDGDANATLLRTRFTIEGNTFTGFGQASMLVNYGVVILTGAGGEVKGNTMAGYSYAGALTGFSSAIHAYDDRFSINRPYLPVRPVRYVGNIFSANDHHLVMVSANDSTVVSNVFRGRGGGVVRWGSVALSGTNVLVERNDFSDLPIGIELFGGEANGSTLRGVTTNPKLFTNQFCRVNQPVFVQPLANGIDERGTEICPDPPPPPRTLNVPGDYTTIQSAVSAAMPGDTIHISAGDYYEQIVIANKGHLTLVGEAGATIYATAGMTETLLPYSWHFTPLVGIYRTDVRVNGLAFDAHQQGSSISTLFGLYWLGSSGELSNCVVRGFNTFGSEGIRIQNPIKVGTPPVTVRLVNNTFEDNDCSIHMRGEPVENPKLLRTTFVIEGNTVTGAEGGTFAGIRIRNGASGAIRRNLIRNHTLTGGGDAFASGIAAYDDNASTRIPFAFVPILPVRYEGNTFSNNDHHLVLVGANDSQVANNIFQGGGPNPPQWGALALSGTNVAMANNDFSDLPTGIVLFGDEYLFANWPTVGPAENARLDANWFCNVPEPIRVNTNLVIGFQEQGTAQCESGSLQPIFQSIRNGDGTGVALTLRGWHGESVAIESSANLETNLVNWVPIFTNTMSLPSFDFHDTNDVGSAQRFYRAVKP